MSGKRIMVTKYHQTRTGINAGKWVICKARKSCRNFGANVHVAKEELTEIKKMRTKIGDITLQEVREYRSFKDNILSENGLKQFPVKTITVDGSEEWRLPNGELHREDGPAKIWSDASEFWYHNGKLHRLDGPAVITSDGVQYWHLNGTKHRDDGPAVTWKDGSQEWYQNNRLHRVDGPAILWKDEKGLSYSEQWYLNDKLHRVDGPAITKPNGVKLWYQNDELHREDGPAKIEADGSTEWYIKGKLQQIKGTA